MPNADVYDREYVRFVQADVVKFLLPLRKILNLVYGSLRGRRVEVNIHRFAILLPRQDREAR